MISALKRKALNERMMKLGIDEADLQEKFIRSSGNGGQNVNKVNSCVWIKHVPTGTEVKCQVTRSQVENRFHARIILCEKLETQILGKESKAARERYKVRKQKKRRSKKAKEKMIAEKRGRSEVKQNRRPPELD